LDERFYDNWTTQLRKGLLEMCILNAMRFGRAYGYEIVRRLRRIEGLVIGEGTIYPILSRFHREGLVESHLEESSEGPARKYYVLSDRGKSLLTRMNATWETIVHGTRDLQQEKD
jgi:PadR family transcriptional regulator PadR